MGTKGTRSSGSQFNPKGVVQGTTLVDPKTGQPVDVITDTNGVRRLAVDATIVLGDVTIETRPLDASTDNVALKDTTTGAKLKINLDGSIDTNVALDAATGDSVLSVGTEDGTTSGTRHVQKIGADGNLRVKDDAAVTELQGINTKLASPLPLPSDAATQTTLQEVADSVDQIEPKLDAILTELTQKTEPANAQNIRPLVFATDSVSVPGVATEAKQDAGITQLTNINTKLANPLPLPIGAATENKQDDANTLLQSIDDKLDGPIPVNGTVSIGDLNAAKDDVAIAGTENGLATGTVRHFVNNRRQQILSAHDRQQVVTYADFGTKDQRVTSIAYTSPTFPGITALKTLTYSLVGTRYRRDNITWSIV